MGEVQAGSRANYEWTVTLYSGAADWSMTFTPYNAFDPERAARELYDAHPAGIKELTRRVVMPKAEPERIAWKNHAHSGEPQPHNDRKGDPE